MKQGGLFLLFFLVSFACAIPAMVQASVDDTVLITEIQIGGITATDEFVSLYNASDEPISLEGWRLIKKTSSGKQYTLVSSFDDAVILPHQHFLIAHKTGYQGNREPDFYNTTANSLASDNSLLLYDADNIIIDTVGWGEASDYLERATLTPQNGSILERKKINEITFQNTHNNQNDFFISDTFEDQDENTTPEIITSPDTPLPTYAIGDIVLNEIMPNPNTGEPEWIELYSRSEFPVSLAGWSLYATNKKIVDLSGIIPALQFFTISLPTNALANGGDLISLHTPQETIADTMYFGTAATAYWQSKVPAPQQGQSLIRARDGFDTDTPYDWYVNQVPTQNLPNKLTPVTNTSTPKIAHPTVFITTQPQTRTTLSLTKLFPNPSGSDEKREYIAIQNNGETQIELNGIKIQDASGKTFVLPSETLAPSTEKILYREQTTIALNNTGTETVTLFDKNDTILDTISYTGPVADNTRYEKDQDGRWSWKNEDECECVDEGTEDSTAVSAIDNLPAETETQIFLPLYISEFLPNPEGSDSEEWIELYNPNETAVILKNWRIDDEEGGSTAYRFLDETIDAHAYLLLPRAQTKIALNNDTDTVRIIAPNGTIIDTITYDNTKAGLSFARTDDNTFLWTQTPTPSEKNSITQQDQETNIAELTVSTIAPEDIILQKNGDTIRTFGYVTVLPNTFNARFFYIDGIQIYSYTKDFPMLHIGDYIDVTGTISITNDGYRIKTKMAADIVVLQTETTVLASDIYIADIDEELRGFFVHILGTVLDIKKNEFYIADETGELRVSIKPTTDIILDTLIPNQKISVQGIISTTKNDLSLLPRTQDDIITLNTPQAQTTEITTQNETPKITQTSRNYTRYLWTGIIGTILLASLYIRKEKHL